MLMEHNITASSILKNANGVINNVVAGDGVSDH
jgi:hypothetical protein